MKPDLVAPGNAIISNRAYKVGLEKQFPLNIVPTTAYSQTSYEPDYFQLSGSSMAAAMVSGAAALMIQKNPQVTPDEVKARLMKTARKVFPASSVGVDAATGVGYTSYYDIFTVGAGYLDIPAALANTDAFSGSAQSPSAVYQPDTGTGSLAVAGAAPLGGSSLVWGTTLVWGTSVLQGNSLVWGTTVVWGTSLVWGTNTDGTTGFDKVWGNQPLWGVTAKSGMEALSVALDGDK